MGLKFSKLCQRSLWIPSCLTSFENSIDHCHAHRVTSVNATQQLLTMQLSLE